MNTKPKFIIADDVPLMRKLVRKILTKAGFSDISEAADGYDLLAQLENDAYNLIICDWDMPKMSGLDALIEIRSHALLKHIPFIMVTAVAEPELVKDAINNGIDEYVVKPIKPEVLTNKVMGLLNKQGYVIKATI